MRTETTTARKISSVIAAGAVVASSFALVGRPAGAQTLRYPATTVTVPTDADRPPVAGDFDGDGRGDLLVYTGRPGLDAIWYGRADGTADAVPVTVEPGFLPVAGDFNGDGIDDLFWHHTNGVGTDVVLYGTPSRSFIGYFTPTAPADATPVVADLDAAGGDDIMWYSENGEDALFLSTGSNFVSFPAAVGPGYQTAAGDFDGDGAGDVILYRTLQGTGTIWWGGRSGRTGQDIFVGPNYTIRAGDFNGDGVDDLLFYAPGDAPDAVLYGRSGRNFLGAAVTAGGNFTPVVADVDGDGTDDVVWYTSGPGEDVVWFFRPDGIALVDASSATEGVPTVVDLNGDGRDDIFFLVAGPAPDTFWFGGLSTTPLGDPAPSDPGGPPTLTLQTVESGLSNPWDLAFTPDGTMLFTERAGRLSARLPNGTRLTVNADMTDLFASGETGLMGIAIDPAFAVNRRFYTCQGGPGPQVKVVAWEIDATYGFAVRTVDPLLGSLPSTSGRHGGCRLRVDPTGALLVGTGDAATGTNPQDLTSLGGKVLRLDPITGQPAPFNPFLSAADAATRFVWTYGHRNVQGLAVRPGSGQVFSVEHGPDRDDEVNLLNPGANYGWDPVPGYNEAVPMTFAGATAAQWSSGSPTVAASGATFLEGTQWNAWNGALAVATLRGRALRVQSYNGAGTLTADVVPAALAGSFGRLRSAVQGPDGSLYVTTDNGGGTDVILRVVPS